MRVRGQVPEWSHKQAATALSCPGSAGSRHSMIGRRGWRRMDVQAGQAPVVGLTWAEAEVCRRRGEANTAVSGTSRTYATILRTNVFSFYNTILFVIGVALLALGRYSDALISVGLGLVNAVISAGQEIRAKGKLDGLQLLDRAPVLVVRDGRAVEVAPDAVVRADVLRVRPGDQVVVDGPLLDGGRVEADESLLTGESEPVVKNPVMSCGRAASAWPAGATSSPATSGRTATPGDSPARRGGPPPTRRRCNGVSSSSCGWSWRWPC